MSYELIVAALDEEVAALRTRHPDARVLVTGPGKVLAAAGLAAALAAEPVPSPITGVLVIGTAGGLIPGMEGVHEIGTVAQHDFDAAAISGLVGRTYGEPIELRPGPHLATGDVFVSDAAQVQALAARGYELVDMEAYAYAHVCVAAGVPVRIVKAVSDGADAAAGASWAANVDRCAEALADWYDEQLNKTPVVR